MTHTPGPWVVDLDTRFKWGRENHEGHAEDSTQGYGDYGGIYDANGNPIVGCDEYDVFWGFNRKDNARLIAAAPDMLAALQGIADFANEIITDIAADIEAGNNGDGNKRDLQAWSNVLAAIAKATGE